MKVLVVSDSHGRSGGIEAILRAEAPDALIHLGDGFDDLPRPLSIPCYQVRGNCDSFACDLPESRVLTLEGVRMFLTHGHRYRVKYSLQSLLYAAREEGAALALFGHSHSQTCDGAADDVVLLNPGSVSSPGHPYAILELSGGTFRYELRNFPNKKSS